jgi:hypothetical protein
MSECHQIFLKPNGKIIVKLCENEVKTKNVTFVFEKILIRQILCDRIILYLMEAFILE